MTAPLDRGSIPEQDVSQKHGFSIGNVTAIVMAGAAVLGLIPAYFGLNANTVDIENVTRAQERIDQTNENLGKAVDRIDKNQIDIIAAQIETIGEATARANDIAAVYTFVNSVQDIETTRDANITDLVEEFVTYQSLMNSYVLSNLSDLEDDSAGSAIGQSLLDLNRSFTSYLLALAVMRAEFQKSDELHDEKIAAAEESIPEPSELLGAIRQISADRTAAAALIRDRHMPNLFQKREAVAKILDVISQKLAAMGIQGPVEFPK